ncbi:DNA polymerase III subunit delta [Clostridium sp. P21]|uniref:DNA polymerase III subunit delta n=1 Tax=Clostridium muellerianum TaxID=2716538 RepID=A0A7Y0EF60_9CLOT|nr:DNA polymerase III subunit delta [Clostridium muellerianum]NMM61962.1 DNA polymerase III subunit delta [Clostridium muellerianum]
MIDIFTFNENIKKNIIDNCYLFCGIDEQLMKDGINSIINKVIDKNFMDLNYVKFDGSLLESFDPVINACETLPFMSDKKVVLVYRANFFQDDKNDSNLKKVYEYIPKLPNSCILIFYDVFKSKRDKPGKNIYKLDKKLCVVKADKIKGQQLETKIKGFFEAKGKQIGKVELRAFSSLMNENNLSIIENEIEKLCCYTCNESISKEDIKELFLKNNDDDIFDLINPISQKNVKESVEVLNELIYRGEKIPYILNMIERQFNRLFRVRLLLENKKSKQDIMKELNIRSDYACDIIIGQSKRFTLKQLKRALQLCLDAEQKIKSSTINQKTEIELLIINTITG